MMRKYLCRAIVVLMEINNMPGNYSIFWSGLSFSVLFWPTYFLLSAIESDKWIYVFLLVIFLSIPLAMGISVVRKRIKCVDDRFFLITAYAWGFVVFSAIFLIIRQK